LQWAESFPIRVPVGLSSARTPTSRLPTTTTRTTTASTNSGTSPPVSYWTSRAPVSSSCSSQLYSNPISGDFDDDEDDWRAFRARLVLMMQQQNETEHDQQQQSPLSFLDNDSLTMTTMAATMATSTTTTTSALSSSASSSPLLWTYDAGSLVEQGSILLSRIEPTWSCSDLDQPYLGKCVILILSTQDEHNDEHDNDDDQEEGIIRRRMTKGIILNRPSDLRLDSEGNVVVVGDGTSSGSGSGWDHEDHFGRVILEEFEDTTTLEQRKDDQWRLFFGGEVSSIPDDEMMMLDNNEEEEDYEDYDQEEEEEEATVILCLHNLSSAAARQVSEQISPGVYITTHDEARSLVASGEATHDSFYLFYGCCVWEPDQLRQEVQNGSWYVASTNLQMLWDELAVLRDNSYDVRFAGLEMWNSLIDKLGKRQEVLRDRERKDDNNDDFADLMLKEWITQNLAAEGQDTSGGVIDDSHIYRALQAAERPPIQAGSLLRASSQPESPFVLENQYLHKATILVLQENSLASLGVILNLPTSDTYSLQITNTTYANFTVRYGGPTSIISVENGVDSIGENEMVTQGEESMIWLHCCAGLKYLRTGKPLAAGDEHGVWTCTQEQVIKAIDLDFASADDFMLVKGLCVWEKEEGAGGVLGQVMSGNLEVVSPDRIDGAWTMLRRQIFLKDKSFHYNIGLADEAWLQAADEGVAAKINIKHTTALQRNIYGSPFSIQELADRARSMWMKIHLL
jgi:putative AlgH/UPF0301 family transcriptional regulator